MNTEVDMVYEEKTLKSERIYEGHILNLRKDTVTVINGESEREIVEHNGGAVIAAIKDDGKIVMVRQYRKAAGRIMLELPAGKRDGEEDYLETAGRELREETGYTAENIRFITRMYTSPGYTEEVLYLYLASDLVPGDTDFDENEAIDIEEYPLDEAVAMVLSGEIEDGKTQTGILMAKAIIDREKSGENSRWK